MSLRTRLALVLAAVMVGPLVAAWIAVGVLVPRATAGAATGALTRAVGSAEVALAERCLGVGDTAGTLAAQLLEASARTGALDAGAARVAVRRAIARRPDIAAAVVVHGRVLAAAGSPAIALAGLDPQRLAALSRSSCSRRLAPPVGPPALAESVPLPLPNGGGTGFALVVEPVDGPALARLAGELGVATGLSLLRSGGPPTVMADVEPAADVPAADRVPAGTAAGGTELDGVIAAVSAGRGSGQVDGRRFLVDRAATGVPYLVLASDPVGHDPVQGAIVLAVVLATLGALVLVALVATRLTRPLAELTAVARRLGGGDLSTRSRISGSDEVGTLAEALDSMAGQLEGTIVELQRSRDELEASHDLISDTFERFGEALGRTHQLDGLLQTVVEAAMRGADAAVGTALLGTATSLEERMSAVADGVSPDVAGAMDALTALAERAVAADAEVLADIVTTAGPGIAVPLRTRGRVIGALAVARDRGAPPLDDAARAAVLALAVNAGTAVANVREHEETVRLSVTDPLTGAWNLRHLSSTLTQEVERATRFGRPLSVLMLDLDHFKRVNDTAGHTFGDAVLREFHRRLKDCLREVDTVARYGGEEFAVLLPETDVAGGGRAAERIVETIRAAPFEWAGRIYPVTVSAGVASFPDHGRSAADLMKAADTALYVAKNDGRDRWAVACDVVDPERATRTARAGVSTNGSEVGR